MSTDHITVSTEKEKLKSFLLQVRWTQFFSRLQRVLWRLFSRLQGRLYTTAAVVFSPRCCCFALTSAALSLVKQLFHHTMNFFPHEFGALQLLSSSRCQTPECHGCTSSCYSVYGWLLCARGRPDWTGGVIYAVIHQSGLSKFVFNTNSLRRVGRIDWRSHLWGVYITSDTSHTLQLKSFPP